MNIEPNKIKQVFEEIVKHEQNKKELSAHISAIYKKLDADGHNVVALKKIVSDHLKDTDLNKIKDIENWIDIYRSNLGITIE